MVKFSMYVLRFATISVIRILTLCSVIELVSHHSSGNDEGQDLHTSDC